MDNVFTHCLDNNPVVNYLNRKGLNKNRVVQ